MGIWKGCDIGTKIYLPSTDLVEITVSPRSGCSFSSTLHGVQSHKTVTLTFITTRM